MGIPADAAGAYVMNFSIRWVRLGARWVLAAVFLFAGIIKVQEPQAFADSIAAYQILPLSLINIAALSLPVLEILVGVMLLSGYEAGLAALMGLLLMGAFAVAMGLALARGLVIECGCFGSGEASTVKMWLEVGRDLLFGWMAWKVMLWNWPKECAEKLPYR